VGDTLPQAVDAAYEQVKKVHFDNAYYRNDIGARALKAINDRGAEYGLPGLC
jgi:phosphoribosylamine--glycine ligase